MDRLEWDEYFLVIANDVKARSTCLRRQVGAVIVKDKQILATGYNGAAKGLPHCETKGCIRDELRIPSGERHELCAAIHAEQNAIIQAARHGVAIQGATLYCNTQPCSICAKMIVNSGIIRVVFEGEYSDERALDILKLSNVVVEQKQAL